MDLCVGKNDSLSLKLDDSTFYEVTGTPLTYTANRIVNNVAESIAHMAHF